MDVNITLRLKNAGFHVQGTDGMFVYLEDPSCILRSFETFIEYAWIAITAITAMLLFGWALSYIRGAKIDSLFINLRNLVLIFGILSAVIPIVNVIYGDDIFAGGCRTIKVSTHEIEKILAAQKNKLATRNIDDLYEDFDIYDSAAMTNLDMPTEIPRGGTTSVSTSENSGEYFANMSDNNSNSTPRTISSTGRGAVSANASNKDVIYVGADGNRYRKTDGTRAWRNNNPGNIISSKFARENGAIGDAGGFAVFPDESTGMAAIGALLRTDKYNSLTVGGAIMRYAPPAENNTSAYQKKLSQLTNIPLNTPMRRLSDEQLQNVANAIRQIEGWKPGRETRI